MYGKFQSSATFLHLTLSTLWYHACRPPPNHRRPDPIDIVLALARSEIASNNSCSCCARIALRRHHHQLCSLALSRFHSEQSRANDMTENGNERSCLFCLSAVCLSLFCRKRKWKKKKRKKSRERERRDNNNNDNESYINERQRDRESENYFIYRKLITNKKNTQAPNFTLSLAITTVAYKSHLLVICALPSPISSDFVIF